MMKKALIAPFMSCCLLSLTGCQSAVEYSLLRGDSYPFSEQASSSTMQEFAIQYRQHCDTDFGCYRYLYAPPKPEVKHFDMEIAAQFTEREHIARLNIDRTELPEFSGSILLVHGFRGSKEWMLSSAAYFQFLGFEVYAFDLLGHGDSSAERGFGVVDSDYIERFVSDNVDTNQPIVAVGYSMGGLVAARLNAKGVSDGAILQAPMTQFDDALVGHFKDNKPWYGFLLPESSLRGGANRALAKVNIANDDTNTLKVLASNTQATLIFASNIDSVAPSVAFKELSVSSSSVRLVEIDKVEHAYMSMIGQEEHQVIVEWLNDNFQH